MKLLKKAQLQKSFSQSFINVFGSKSNPALQSFDQPLLNQTTEPIYTERKISSSRLENGVTILTETSSLPSNVHMGILLNVGTRDENKKTSGACHSIQTTYYKSFAFTNETINFGMVQMSGGNFKMNFNRENIWYNASCLGHDVIDIFNMMTDCALEPRNFNSVSAAIAKLPHSLKAKLASFGWDDFNDLVFQSAYGNEGLGNHLLGDEKNFKHLDSMTMQEFQLDHISPEKIIVCGVGVNNHGEFHELVESKLHNLFYNQNCIERKPSKFLENDIRIPGSGKSSFAILFESDNIKNVSLHNYLLSELLGQVEVNNFDLLGLNQGFFNKNIYNKEKFVLGMEARNFHFSDSGFFMFRGQVSGNQVNSLIEKIAVQLKGLQTVDSKEFEKAKKRLSLNIQQNLNSGNLRVTEYLKQQSSWNSVKGNDILSAVNDLKIEDFKKFTKNLTKNKMCFVLKAPELNSVYGHDQIKKLFN